jgi:hypothetical protein
MIPRRIFSVNSVPSLFLHKYSDYLLEQLDPHQAEDLQKVEDGFSLYREGMVQDLYVEKNFVMSSVFDGKKFDCLFHTHLFSLNTCNCNQRLCQHMMASFFAMYSETGNAETWINEWKLHHNFEDKAIPKTVVSNSKKAETDLYKQWIDLTDHLFEKEILSNKSMPPYLLNLHGLVLLKKLMNHYDAGYEFRKLFQIVVNVRLLERLLDWFISSRYSYQEIEDMCKQLVEAIQTNIETETNHLPNPLPFSYDPICQKLRGNVRELLFLQGAFDHVVLQIYRLLWQNLFHQKKLRKEELAFAEKTAAKSDTKSSWRVAYSFQLLISGQVNDAVAVIESSGPEHSIYILDYMDYFAKKNDWNSVKRLAPSFVQHVKTYMEQADNPWRFINYVDSIFEQVSEHTLSFDLQEQVLVEMLPYSRKRLANFYFERKKYKRMLEFIQVSGFWEPDREQLRLIQKEAPECLLPYYHREVMKAIERKNRKSYKEAVRYLKKLRTIYKKLNKETTWEYYLENLLEDTKRLRAFQEECQRGKLVHVENEAIRS